MWGVSLPRPMLLPVGTFSYTPCAGLCGDYLFYVGTLLPAHHVVLHGEFFLNPFLMFLYVGSFSDTPDAVLRGEFLLHTPCYLMWEDSLTCRILFYVVSFFHITNTDLFCFSSFFICFCFSSFSGKCLLDCPCCFMWGFLLHYSCFFYTGSIFSMPYDIWYQEFLLHILCKFMWRHFQIVCTVFFRVKIFFDTPHAILCWTFLLQFDVQYTSLFGEFFLHTPC